MNTNNIEVNIMDKDNVLIDEEELEEEVDLDELDESFLSPSEEEIDENTEIAEILSRIDEEVSNLLK